MMEEDTANQSGNISGKQLLTALMNAILVAVFCSGFLFLVYSWNTESIELSSYVKWNRWGIPAVFLLRLIIGLVLAQKEPSGKSQFLSANGLLPGIILGMLGMGALFMGHGNQVNILEGFGKQVKADQDAFPKVRQRPVLRGQPLAGDGASMYLDLFLPPNGIPKFQKEFESMVQSVNQAFKPERQLGKTYQEPIAWLRKSTQFEQYTFPVNLVYSAKLPDFRKARLVAEVLTRIAVGDCQKGAYEDGLKLIADGIRINQDLAFVTPSLLGLVAGLSNQFVLMNHWQECMRQGLPDSLYQQLLHEVAILNQHSLLASSQLPLQAEITMMRDSFVNASGKSGFLSKIYLIPQQNDALRKTGFIELLFQQIVPFYQPLHPPSGQIPEAFKQNTLDYLTQNDYVAITLPQFAGIGNQGFVIQAALNGFLIQTSLELYRNRHQQYPQKLDELDSIAGSPMPFDPFSNRPYGYSQQASGKYLLYSVGLDRKDNQGKPAQGMMLSGTPETDIVFPTPKGSEKQGIILEM